MKQSASRPNSVQKSLEILLAFQAEQPIWGVRELSQALGFSPSTVQRILKSLKIYGFLDQDADTRQYRLGNVYYRFLDTLQSTYPVTRVALPFMKRLLSVTQETVHLNVIEGIERVCIEHVESPQLLKASMPVGNRSPLYAGASSRCLLAFSSPAFIDDYLRRVNPVALTGSTPTDPEHLRAEIDLTRRRGWAESLGERTPGLGSLSAPVRSHNGTLLAAVSLAIPEVRFKEARHRQFCLNELLTEARALSGAMGHRESKQ
jgi:IclR family KDG regulon transcriptional repressor